VRVTNITDTVSIYISVIPFSSPSSILCTFGLFSTITFLWLLSCCPAYLPALHLVGLSNITHTNPLAKAFIRSAVIRAYHIFLD